MLTTTASTAILSSSLNAQQANFHPRLPLRKTAPFCELCRPSLIRHSKPGREVDKTQAPVPVTLLQHPFLSESYRPCLPSLPLLRSGLDLIPPLPLVSLILFGLPALLILGRGKVKLPHHLPLFPSVLAQPPLSPGKLHPHQLPALLIFVRGKPRSRILLPTYLSLAVAIAYLSLCRRYAPCCHFDSPLHSHTPRSP